MIDTHCHIHSSDYGLDADQVLERARSRGVTAFFCVGTSVDDSIAAANFAANRPDCVAAAAIHPHNAATVTEQDKLQLEELFNQQQVQAIGECGLDYHYLHSPADTQQALLHWHLALAVEYGLPTLFHIRDAFDDFWQIYDQYQLPKAGVVHSFTAGVNELDQILERNLLVAFNGIITFSNDPKQLAALDRAPLESIVLETDAPYLTPKPFRGKINEPEHVYEVAEFVAKRKGVSLDRLEQITDANARRLLAR